MKISKDTYARFADAHAPRSPLLKDCLWAFLVGGCICTVGQMLRDVQWASQFRCPIEFIGHSGGVIITPDEITRKISEMVK